MKTNTIFHKKTWALMKRLFTFMALLTLTANISVWGQTITIGTGTGYSSSNTITPYSTSYMDGRHQYLILASEIIAAGGQTGTITHLGFQLYSVGSPAMSGFTVSLKQTTITELTTTYETGLTTVYSNASYTPAGTGWQWLALDLPFAWNGTSNIVVQVCFDNTSWSSSSSVYYSTVTGNMHHYGYADSETGCTMTAPTYNGVNANRPNIGLYFSCSSPMGLISSTSYYLTNVTTTGGTQNINNTTTFASGGYSNYYSPTYSCIAAAGSAISITLTTSTSTHHYYIWIDWNADGDYLDSGETLLATTGYTNGYTLNYTVPAGTAPGPYRMRVANSYAGTITPCGPAYYGEYEDYMFVVCTCPANETCAGATYISSITSSYSASGVLGCIDDCSGLAYHDVFYRFTPQVTGSYTVNMGDSYGDTYMKIYSGTCCTGTLVATGDDEYGGADPQVTLNLTGGTTYYFECGSYSSSETYANSAYNFNLVRNCDSVPANETCAGAVAISSVTSSYHTSGILGCTNDCSGLAYYDVFYSFAPAASGSYTIDMGLSDGDTYLKMYSGTCCTGTVIATGDQEYGGSDPMVTVYLNAGTTYYIECGSYYSSGYANAAFNLNLVRNCDSVPTNETCTGAVSISNYSLPYSFSGILGCTNDCASYPYNDVFFAFTPLYTGSYTADMAGSDGNTEMKLWGSGCCGTQLAYDDNSAGGYDPSITYTLTGGTTYYFECGSWYSTGYSNAPFNFHLVRNCSPQTNETCATAKVIPSYISSYGTTDTLGCTDDCAGYPYHDVFYSFTPQATGSYTADMYLSEGDTYMKVYSGSCCGTLVAYNDDGAGDMDPQITYTFIGGTTYYFELGSLSSSQYMSNTVFNFNLVRNCDSVPTNETCAGAVTISNTNVPYSTTGILGCTDDCAGYPYNDVFYAFTPYYTGSYTADMLNSDGDTYMKLWTGSCCGTLLASDDDGAGDLDPEITYTLTGGTTYYFECGSLSSTGYANAPFNFNLVRNCAAPANETCAGATSITFAQIVAGYNTSGTLGCTNDCASYPYHDVFFRFNCTMTGIYTFDMRNSDGNTEMRITSGSCCGTYVAYDNDSYGGQDPQITVTLYAGTSYWIECGNYYNSDYYTGTAYNLYASYKPWNDECTAVTPDALPVGTTLTYTGNNTNATTDCSSIIWATVWYAFTTTQCSDVTVNLCGTSPAFATAGVVLTQCPCSSTIYGAYNNSECGDGNFSMHFDNLPAGTYYYPVYSQSPSVGYYTLHIISSLPTAVPTLVTATPSLILCGNGSSELNATSAGNNINWYTVATGGTPFGTTASGANIYVSPSATTTYYAEASAGGNNDTITTVFAGSIADDGNMFDVNILQDITVSSFDVNLPTGVTADLAIYFKTGTHVGSENTPGAWTLAGTATGIVSLGADVRTPLNLNLNLHLAAGQTYAFYVTVTNGANMRYNTGTAVGNVYVSNAQLQVEEGSAVLYPFSSVYSPRIWNGIIRYVSGSCISARTPVTVTVTSVPSAPTPVTATPAAICNGGTSQLNATSAGNTIEWFTVATGGTNVGTSNSGVNFAVSPTTTTTYYAEAEAAHTSTVGPLNPANTGAFSSATFTNYYLIFNVADHPTKITSVDIFPTAPVGSAFAITISNAGGTQIFTTGSYSTTVTGGAKQTVPINFTVPVGTGYRMQMGLNPGLNRNSTGAVYPYTNGNISITGNSFDPNYYYFCYNWNIEQPCSSTRTPVTVTITPNNTITLSAGGTQTKCINTAITTTTYATTGATGATVTGLPAGVTGSWASNVVTISGTPTASGTYNYTVSLTGGCGTISANGTITVVPNNTVALTAGGTQTKCINTAITTTTYATTGATGATVTGLPAGVTGSWAANVVSISGTPTVTGTYTYTVTLTGGCGTTTATGTITVSPNNTIVLTAGGAQTKCINTAITTTTYATTGATGATVTGLPTGVTGSWAANVVTISGTPTVTGTFTYSVTLTGGCGTTTAAGTITVTPNNTITLSAGGTQTKCINTAITTTTYATTGATGATVTGLPAGVTGSWAANTVTISGTPTASGTFNYTVTLTGGCGTVTATGTITVTPANTITLTAGGTQSKCINTAITTTTYATTGATGATVTGLPAGVTGSWAANTVTISGTPTASGTFNYTVTLTGGCGTITATGTITVNSIPTAEAGANATYTGTPILIGDPANGPGTCSWLPTAGLNNPNICQPLASPATTTTYTLTVNNNDCIATDVVTITAGVLGHYIRGKTRYLKKATAGYPSPNPPTYNAVIYNIDNV
ncbi:MAG TPA: GEVED domain-containing protein, partial [Bacteroidales bacterium]|nr:GEVED domain-containing protein [Bacteroidales bacterium]